MGKTLCKLKKKTLKKNPERYIQLVAQAEYLCTSCGRVAAREKWLCEPRKM